MEVAGKAIVVTGSSGGIGGALANALAAAGATVFGVDAHPPSGPFAGMHITADVTVEDDVLRAMQRIGAQAGRVDAIVIAAGVQLHGADGPVDQVTPVTWRRTIDINLTGAYLCLHHAVPFLLRCPTSSVILIGSPTGLTMSGAGYSAYAASKAGMMALARVLAADYGRRGLRANVVVPGTTETPLIKALLENEATRQSLVAGSALGRIGTPQDLCGIVQWLASDASSFATGAFFAVDGGLTAR